MTGRDIERRLKNAQVPAPPEGLSRNIIDEIPDRLELHPDLEKMREIRRPFHHRGPWLAAAAIFAVALAGALTWELRRTGPLDGSGLPTAVTTHRKTVADVVAETLAEDEVTFEESVESVGMALDDAPDPSAGREESSTTGPFLGTVDAPGSGAVAQQGTAAPPTRQFEPAAPAQPLVERTSLDAVSGEEPEASTRIRAPEPTTEGHAIDARSSRRADADRRIRALPAPRESESRHQREQEAPSAKSRSTFASPVSETAPGAEDSAVDDLFFERSRLAAEAEEAHLDAFDSASPDDSYTLTINSLRSGSLPPRAAIRVEDFVDHFNLRELVRRSGGSILGVEAGPSSYYFGGRTHTLRIAPGAGKSGHGSDGGEVVDVDFNSATVSTWQRVVSEDTDSAAGLLGRERAEVAGEGNGKSQAHVYTVVLRSEVPLSAPLATVHYRYPIDQGNGQFGKTAHFTVADLENGRVLAPGTLEFITLVGGFAKILGSEDRAEPGRLEQVLQRLEDLRRRHPGDYGSDPRVAELEDLVRLAIEVRGRQDTAGGE